mmetsp:Transcript_36279/g.107600  ORF Transcript_36279/g.107600 Transcript_36279/m.107600 type:complete len:304 (-) Transcript_36279:67-978(-)
MVDAARAAAAPRGGQARVAARELAGQRPQQRRPLGPQQRACQQERLVHVCRGGARVPSPAEERVRAGHRGQLHAARAPPRPPLGGVVPRDAQAADGLLAAHLAPPHRSARHLGRRRDPLPRRRRRRGLDGKQRHALGQAGQDAQPRPRLAHLPAAARAAQDLARPLRPPLGSRDDRDAARRRLASLAPLHGRPLRREGHADRLVRVCAPRRGHRDLDPRVPLRGAAQARLRRAHPEPAPHARGGDRPRAQAANLSPLDGVDRGGRPARARHKDAAAARGGKVGRGGRGALGDREPVSTARLGV